MTSQTQNSNPSRAAIILCGGQSRRMGRAKADLPFGDETLLQRTVRTVSHVVNGVVVVAAAEQTMPHFSTDVVVVRDELEYAGPLAGIGLGLRALRNQTPTTSDENVAAYVTSCDVPWLQPTWIEAIFARLDEHDIVVPYDEEYAHPLAAVYRLAVGDVVDQMVSAGERRPRDLFQRVRTLRVATKSLEHVDANQMSLMNVNTPEAYRDALQRAGYDVPAWVATAIQNDS